MKWIFDKQEIRNSPSFKEGIEADMEDRYRREGVRFLTDVGSELKLSPQPTLATAAVYFHRFYMFHSFKEFSRHLTALGCLFLAGKTEETPKKCRDIVLIAKEKLSEKHYQQAFGRGDKDPKEEVMSVERVLLQTIKFDLQLEHPYTFLLKYAKIIKVDKEKVRNMVQMAWTFVNDSLCTTLCLQWEPEIIAIALMYLAGRLSKVDIKDWHNRPSRKIGDKTEDNWWDVVVEDCPKEYLEDICHQVLDLYSSSSGRSVPTPSQGSAASTPRTPSNSSPAPSTSSGPRPVSNTPVGQTPVTTSASRAAPPPPGVPVQQVPVLGSATPVPLGVVSAAPPQRLPPQPQTATSAPAPPSFPPPPVASYSHPAPVPNAGYGGYNYHDHYVPPPGHQRFPPHAHGMPPMGNYHGNYHHQNSYEYEYRPRGGY